jgi:hypothetical protein
MAFSRARKRFQDQTHCLQGQFLKIKRSASEGALSAPGRLYETSVSIKSRRTFDRTAVPCDLKTSRAAGSRRKSNNDTTFNWRRSVQRD